MDSAIARLTGLTLNPETPPHQPHNYADPDVDQQQSEYDEDQDVDQKDDKPEGDEKNILSLRALLHTREAGVIIGKGGKNVAEVRNETGVKAGVSKVVPGVQERILTISGTTLNIAKVMRRP
jgi:heterogeneous nuclear rnp K-like protein 2